MVDHPQVVGLGEGFGDLHQLPLAVIGPEVDGGTHSGCPQVPGLLDLSKEDLLVPIRVGQELVVVDLDHERESCRRTYGTSHPSTPRVEATALQPPSIARRMMFSGSKYAGLGANEAAAECSIPWSTGSKEMYPVPARRPVPYSPAQVHQNVRRPVRATEDLVDVIGSRQMQDVLGNPSRLMVQQVVSLVPEQLYNAIDL